MANPRNVFGWHVSASNLAVLTPEAYATSAVIKVLVEGHSAFRLREVRDKAPHALIVARLIDVDQEERELHARAYRREDPVETGRWFADVIAGIAKPLGLDFVIWESGPNELNSEADPWWARYCLSFLARMREHGLIAALGGMSPGRPKIPPYDTVDEWKDGGWLEVVAAIDYANRSAGRVVAYLYDHEYSGPRDVRQAMGFHLARYRYLYDTHIKPRGLFAPLLITEWNYAQGAQWPEPLPNTEERIEQELWLNNEYSKDEYLAGVAVYFLEDNQPPAWEVRQLVAPYSQKMISGGYVISHPRVPPIGDLPPPPPQPDVPDWKEVAILNAGFEMEFVKRTADLTVPTGWTVWGIGGLEGIHSESEYHPPHVRQGNVSARVWVSGQKRVFGYYQRVPVKRGASLQFFSFGRAWSTDNPQVGNPSDGPMAMAVGIDPRGGTDASAALWGAHTNEVDAFVPLRSPQVIAESDFATVFVKGDVQEPRARSDFWWDDTQLLQMGSDPIIGSHAIVTVSGLRLRQSPSLTSPIIYQMQSGTQVKIIESGAAWHLVEVVVVMRWYQVDVPITLRGYSAVQYLRIMT